MTAAHGRAGSSLAAWPQKRRHQTRSGRSCCRWPASGARMAAAATRPAVVPLRFAFAVYEVCRGDAWAPPAPRVGGWRRCSPGRQSARQQIEQEIDQAIVGNRGDEGAYGGGRIGGGHRAFRACLGRSATLARVAFVGPRVCSARVLFVRRSAPGRRFRRGPDAARLQPPFTSRSVFGRRAARDAAVWELRHHGWAPGLPFTLAELGGLPQATVNPEDMCACLGVRAICYRALEGGKPVAIVTIPRQRRIRAAPSAESRNGSG